MTSDLISRLKVGGTPPITSVVASAWMTSAPTTESQSEKRPPASEAPPMTTARIASSSSQSPALFASAPWMSAVTTMPASAAQSPEIA